MSQSVIRGRRVEVWFARRSSMVSPERSLRASSIHGSVAPVVDGRVGIDEGEAVRSGVVQSRRKYPPANAPARTRRKSPVDFMGG